MHATIHLSKEWCERLWHAKFAEFHAFWRLHKKKEWRGMYEYVKKNRNAIFSGAIILILICVLPFSSCEAAQVYQISEEQLTELSMITKRQEERLALLQTKLSVLEMSSTEQEKKLTEVLSQLQKSKNQLAEVQKSLENANVSLEKARLIISEQEKSLTQLEKAVKDLEHRARLAKRQRNVWAALSGGLLLYGMAK